MVRSALLATALSLHLLGSEAGAQAIDWSRAGGDLFGRTEGGPEDAEGGVFGGVSS